MPRDAFWLSSQNFLIIDYSLAVNPSQYMKYSIDLEAGEK